MKCNKCGKEFDGNFCPRCGNPALEKKEETETNVKNKKAEYLGRDSVWVNEPRTLKSSFTFHFTSSEGRKLM